MNRKNDDALQVGFGVADVTPPEGLPMSGNLDARLNQGTSDPLLAKALYACGGGGAVAIVGLDLISLPRELADQAIAEACRRCDIAAESIIISCSHTHTGPYTVPKQPELGIPGIDAAYKEMLITRIAESIEQAFQAVQPATMHLGRTLMYREIHHRRVVVKSDGRVNNTWMERSLDDLSATPQVLGTAGPIDPELWVVRFDSLDGQVLGALVNFSLHANSYFGTTWSADYPGVIAQHMAAAFGEQAVTVFTPGACANINPLFGGADWRKGAAVIAEAAVNAASRAVKAPDPVVVAAARRNVNVPRRNPDDQRPGAIERLNWGGGGGRADIFEPYKQWVASMPQTLEIPVSAAQIGPLGIATNAGELFVEWGIEIKRRSPFPHTFVAQLTNALIAYQPDRLAFEQEGYETLVGANYVPLEGIQMLVDNAVELLQELWRNKNSK